MEREREREREEEENVLKDDFIFLLKTKEQNQTYHEPCNLRLNISTTRANLLKPNIFLFGK